MSKTCLVGIGGAFIVPVLLVDTSLLLNVYDKDGTMEH